MKEKEICPYQINQNIVFTSQCKFDRYFDYIDNIFISDPWAKQR